MKKSVDSLANHNNTLGLRMIILKRILELIKKDEELNLWWIFAMYRELSNSDMFFSLTFFVFFKHNNILVLGLDDIP